MTDYIKERDKLNHRLQGYANGISNDLADLLTEAREEVEEKILYFKAKIEDRPSAIKKKQRSEKLRAEIDKILGATYSDIGKEITDKAVELGTAAPEITADLIQANIGINLSTPILETKRVKAWFESSQIDGLFFNDWVKKLEQNSADRLMREVHKSMILQENLRETTKRVQNALNVSRKSAGDLAHNAIQTAHNWAEREMYYANSEQIKGFRHVSELDRRVSQICQTRDGHIYKKGEERVPPLHWLCRSYLAPVWKDEELNRRTGKRITRQDTESRFVKHRDGTTSTKYEKRRVKFVPAEMNYNNWMKSLINSKDPKDVSFAREALGKTRFNLVKSGRLKMKSLYYRSKPPPLAVVGCGGGGPTPLAKLLYC